MASPASIAAGLTGALLLSGGLVCFSENAVPGSPLYGIKTSISEPVQVALSGSAGNKAQVEANLAQKRVGEGEKLAIEGSLTPAKGQELANSFQVSADEAKKNVAVAAETNPQAAASIATTMCDALSRRLDLLLTLDAQADANTKDALASLIAAVQAETGDCGKLTAALNAKAAAPDLTAKVNACVSDVQSKLNNALNAAADLKAQLGANAAANADAVDSQVKAAGSLLAQAQGQLNLGALTQAKDLCVTADKLLNDASLNASLLLDLNANGGLNGALNADGTVNANGNAAADVKATADGVISTVKATGKTGLKLNGGLNLNGGSTGGVNLNGTTNPNLNVNGSVNGGGINANVNGAGGVNLNVNANGNLNTNTGVLLNANGSIR